MRFVNKEFEIEINYYYGKLVMSLFNRMVSIEIKELNKVLNLFNILDIESEVLDVSWAAIMLGAGV